MLDKIVRVLGVMAFLGAAISVVFELGIDIWFLVAMSLLSGLYIYLKNNKHG
jgi:hypothetical protein